MGNNRSGTHPRVERVRQENRIIHTLGIDPLDPHGENDALPLQRKKRKLKTVSFRAAKSTTSS